jgi:hypothetical protein
MKQKYSNLLLSAVILISTAFTGEVFGELIKSTPVVTASVGQLYHYDVNVWPVGDSTFTLVKALTGMTIDAHTGLISWTPTALDQGGPVIVSATAGTTTEEQAFNVYISDGVLCDESMISYWKFEETTGTTFADFKGGFNAVTSVAPDDTTGIVGIGQKFNPARDIRLSVPDNQNQYDWKQGQDISASLWFKCNHDISSADGPQIFMGRLGTSGTTEFMHWWWFGLDTNNYVSVSVTNDVGTLEKTDPRYPNMISGHSTYGVYYTDNKWHQAVFTLDGNASNAYTLKIYVDGELKTTENKTLETGDFTSAAELNLGWWQNPWSADFEYQGIMDEPAIYKRALTAAEIYQMYTDGLAHKPYCKPGNYAPIFKSTPVLTATEDVLYSYSIVTSDYDVNNTLTITKASGPDWLSVSYSGNGTATLSGTPLNANVGANAVTIAVNDGTVTVNQSFSIEVANVNDLPTITSTPVITGKINTLYQYWVEAHDDEDGFPLLCEATIKPSWATFSYNNTNGTGLLSGTPVATDSINARVALKVTDSNGGTYTQQFTIHVEGGFSAIDDLGNNNGIRVYPSPAKDYVTIEFEEIFRNGSFRLMSLSGALVKEIPVNTEKTVRIDLSDIQQGIYIYELAGSGKKIIGKIAKE